jgi:hypothetical protein
VFAVDYKKLSLGLGFFSLALGAAELLAPKKIAKELDAEGHETLVKGFGAREIAAGLAIVNAPAHSLGIWNRVLGDMMDLTALGVAAKNAPRNKAVWGSLAFVAGATLLDYLTARGLDQQTGKLLPVREQGESSASERVGPGNETPIAPELAPA